jgi:outer membrane lipoprotein-sorting protein
MILAALASILLAPPQGNAKSLLAGVTRAYSRLASYQDLITATSTTRSTVWRQSFKTWFIRPGRWRTDYSEVLPSGTTAKVVVWMNGNSPKLWDGNEITAAPNVGIGYGSLAMVGGNFVKLVPSLLDPKAITDSFLAELVSPILLADSKIGDIFCHRIRAKEADASSVEIWIGRRSKLIMRVVRTSNSPHFGAGKATVDYLPIANPKIPPSTFDFRPPQTEPVVLPSSW